jgi:predicted ATPase
MLTLAQDLAHPFSLALALYFAAWLHLLRGEVQATREKAEALIALSTEQGYPHRLAGGTIRRGWAVAKQGRLEEGITQMQQGLAALRAAGTEVVRSWSLTLLAEAYGNAGHVEEGLAALTEALAVIDQNEERSYEAEVYRLKGELTLAQSSVQGLASSVAHTLHPIPYTRAEAEAEVCFGKAIEVARKQQAKSLELRAVMSLSRLWQQQGKKEEAHQLLAEIYGWFTEGFDTKDLQDAKRLIEELSSGGR